MQVHHDPVYPQRPKIPSRNQVDLDSKSKNFSAQTAVGNGYSTFEYELQLEREESVILVCYLMLIAST